MAPARSIEIFRAGTHTPMSGEPITFSQADLQKTAAAYDPSVHEAPIVVGHPKTDAPAYGWVEKLVLDIGGLILKATLDQVEPSFAETVNAGRYKKISASFWKPTDPNNPRPGVYYLKHVGFLGAAAPAVKGLKSVAFADDQSGVVTFGAFDAGEEAAFYKAEVARMKLEAFLEQQIAAGRLLPIEAPGALAFMEAIDNTAAISFADGDGTVTQSPADWFRNYVARQPQRVVYGKYAMPDTDDAARFAQSEAASFAVPQNHTPDPAAMEMHEQIAAEATRRNIPYLDALRIVARRQK